MPRYAARKVPPCLAFETLSLFIAVVTNRKVPPGVRVTERVLMLPQKLLHVVRQQNFLKRCCFFAGILFLRVSTTIIIMAINVPRRLSILSYFCGMLKCQHTAVIKISVNADSTFNTPHE